jgi:hypothetical protein
LILEANMLTTQESLEALAGRSPEGKPLASVSQQDYDALRKKYELLLAAANRPNPYWRSKAAWVGAIAVIGVAIVVAVAHRPVASAQVEPYGGGFYTANDLAGVHAANAFCMAREAERQMRPLYALGGRGLFFDCVKSDEEVAADKREAARQDAEPWQFTPSAENPTRCVELRDQMTQVAAEGKGTNPDAVIGAAKKMEELNGEAATLNCRRKP